MDTDTSADQALPFASQASRMTIIRASGEDAEQFLHGQFSQKIQGLGDRTTLAAYCSPKGRMLAALRVWRSGGDIMLALPADMAEGFLKRLRMFVLRSKVVLEEVLPAPKAVILTGEAGERALADMDLPVPAAGMRAEARGFTLLGIEPAAPVAGFCPGGSRTLMILPEGATLADLPFAAAPNAWAVASSIAAGVAQILPQTRELFVPQHVNFELVGGVTFSKGCYPGQEIISRLQHIGETNRRGAVGMVNAEVTAASGAPVYSGGEECGRIIRAVTLDGRTLVFYSATLASFAAGVTLTPEGEPLEPVALPYRYRNVLKEPA